MVYNHFLYKVYRRAAMFGAALLLSVRMFGVGWTPTDCGLVVNFETDDQFLLSVMIDGTEYFVCHYPSSMGGRGKFKYDPSKGQTNILKLIPQDEGATTPSPVSVWTIEQAMNRGNNALGGIAYTMWSNYGYSLMTGGNTNYKFLGDLTNNKNNNNLCDVVFVLPTNTSTDADPNNTLAKPKIAGQQRDPATGHPSFDGGIGIGFAGMVYREVYMFDIPRNNAPISYTNAALVTFNTTDSPQKWSNRGGGTYDITCASGCAAYAYADNKHKPTPRTLFRLYVLNKPISSCPDSYFFGWDVQDYRGYRTGSYPSTDYSTAKKIYALDHFECMERVGETEFYQTDMLRVPSNDSTYFYVGKQNKYYDSSFGVALGSSTSPKAYSLFTNIKELRVRALKDEPTAYIPPVGALGRMVVDTTSGVNNLDVSFDPAGYFLKVSTGFNVRMHPQDDGTWISEEMWTINDTLAALQVKATLFTGAEYSADDPGADVEGWSKFVTGTSVPVVGGGRSIIGCSGWARINPADPDWNGGIDFVPANPNKKLHYDYQGLIGVQIPDQHPIEGSNTVRVLDARLKEGFTFLGWATEPGGAVVYHATGREGTLHVGDEITLTADSTNLYAVATFDDTYRVAFSFIHPTDHKRYFITHPGLAPKYAHSRHYDDWTHVWQGLGDTRNEDPNYLSTYKMIGGPDPCLECEPGEDYVLYPGHEVVHGVEDSLEFYRISPDQDEYMGLYYLPSINTLLANPNWRGMFRSTEGWPSYRLPSVDSTKIYSAEYLDGFPDAITKHDRPRTDYLQYKSETDQFDGVDTETDGTTFQISAVVVADAHYVILPDTTTEWTNEITFGYHQNERTNKQVWSKLIGKQLLACMRVGNDTVYFHPNNAKTMTDASALRLSPDYRLAHAFRYMRDERVEAQHVVATADKPTFEETTNDFCCNITSGNSSPMNIRYRGNYIDIVDTLRVWLQPGGISKIKNYYGRWKTGSPGLHHAAYNSRYRDILVTTKTYHYGEPQAQLQLVPEFESYALPALTGQDKTLNFRLTKIVSRTLYDAQGNPVSEQIIATTDTTVALNISTATRKLKYGTFCEMSSTTSDQITLRTLSTNSSELRYDTLTVTLPAGMISGFDRAVTAVVPITQVALIGDELVWSVVYNKKRYFILANNERLRFRQYTQNGSTLYKSGTSTALVKGAANPENSDTKYITPWNYEMIGTNQITLYTAYGIDKYFAFNGDDEGTAAASPVTLTYEMVNTYANSNGNYEEIVYLKYVDKWLKFDGANSKIVLVDSKSKASQFSWGYLKQEYNILNNGNYPSSDHAEFGYNSKTSTSITTSYKAYREYTMLLSNARVNLCRQQVTDSATLANDEWKTSYNVSLIRDARFGVDKDSSKIKISTKKFQTTITPTGSSPLNTQIGGKYVNIVDTLQVTVGIGRDYKFADKWSGYSSISDACLKIPLIRRTYHEEPFNTVVCTVENDEYNFAFPSTMPTGPGADSTHTFVLYTENQIGRRTMSADGEVVASTTTSTTDLSDLVDFTDEALADIQLKDDYGKPATWCKIVGKTANTITVKCLTNGIRSPRSAKLEFSYMVVVNGKARFVNFDLSVSQASLFQYENNQYLVHTAGASGDPLMDDGRQQAHENKRILYYYNPEPYDEPDQNVELPIRERGFYGWWRWYREGKDENDSIVNDADVPDSLWIMPPRNVGKYNFPFRTIGDSVWKYFNNPEKGGARDSVRKLVTMGRYTVFHNPASEYAKADPPSKAPYIAPPVDKKVLTYVADLGAYYDNLPLQMANVDQIDIDRLDTMRRINEPTLSLREVFELHPWTEMAEKMEGYKDTIASGYRNLRYMEDHVVMAPINPKPDPKNPNGSRLLLPTEQRYNYGNLQKKGHSESLLGYYLLDDHWYDLGWDAARKDTMIWCVGWDAEAQWYTYDPKADPGEEYTPCDLTITESDDYLSVPAKTLLPAGQDFDTVYYCLRAQSKSSAHAGTVGDPDDVEPKDGLYMFNICRYMIIYHRPAMYGPKQEVTANGVTKAIITNDEIEQDYEVLERLNFDYNHPGKDYRVYPHPLPWADGSYGYSYPVGPEIPDNRHHNDFAPNFPGVGEYGIINRIPYDKYWHKMEQHGGAENGYMIYCDGMSSSGQVAALTLKTDLCEGQKLYFSAYVGNPSSQSGKSNPNFTFSVQGKGDVGEWEDISSFMTGDILPSNKWSQIYFPIVHDKAYNNFRVRIYNMSSDFDGNDFIIDDMCIFATKPPLIAYQANTKCVEQNETDSIIHVVLRVDYQGFIDTTFNNTNVYYTVEKITQTDPPVRSFVPMIDHYINEEITHGTIDTIYGHIVMPRYDYVPGASDSIFTNLNELAEMFERSVTAQKIDPEKPLFRRGFIYEELEGETRPVLYVVHKAKMTADNTYNVRMSLSASGLLDSKCAMTSNLKVTNRMVLMLNGEEQQDKQVDSICANSTYDLSLRVKGTLMQDGTAPVDISGTCKSDWLLYGDTLEDSSLARYGYRYSDIVTVVKDILRYDPAAGERNANQFARNMSEISKNELKRVQGAITLSAGVEPYELLDDLVTKGFLKLYQSGLSTIVSNNDSVQYIVLPIVGTGTEDLRNMNMEVCPTPIFIKLKPKPDDKSAPIEFGGVLRDSTQASLPLCRLTPLQDVDGQIPLLIKSLASSIGVRSVTLESTDDPNFFEGVHVLNLVPDKQLPRDVDAYYTSGDTIYLSPDPSNNYQMRAGYNYTFTFEMQTYAGASTYRNGCPVGSVPLTLSIVPDYLLWDPKSPDNNQWNRPDNWLGVDQHGTPIHRDAHFAPLSMTKVIIPTMTDGLPYPVLPEAIAATDSIRQVGFDYNSCDAIRFMPGVAMGGQQYLTYDKAVVDMHIPYQKWALRSAPVTGMISGDIYMANANMSAEASPWDVATFDAAGRSYTTGNASFWLSVYSQNTTHVGNGEDIDNDSRTAAAEWSKVTNALTMSLPVAQGWAVYTKTASGADADVRLPKNDDVYYYYYRSGERADELYEPDLRAMRNTNAGGSAGQLAFTPEGTGQTFTLRNGASSTLFVFGNPTMAYIDIWGFVADNSLNPEIDYVDADGVYTTVNLSSAMATTDTIINPKRYLPPMHAMVVKVAAVATEKEVTLRTSRVLTSHTQVAPAPAPRRMAASKRSRGIMTVMAVNPVSDRCVSRLLIGQGYSDELIEGEDAVLTTVNIDQFSMTNTPTTPFNIYASEGGYGLSIDLRDSIVNVPISFYMSDLPFDERTQLWFAGVNRLDGQYVLYDLLTGTERTIIDGICLEIETPQVSHQTRYYIRRRGYTPGEDPSNPVATGAEATNVSNNDLPTTKIISGGHVYIIRNGEVYSIFGQKLK